MLYRPAPPVSPPRRGRPRKHGSRFAFQDPTTWGKPDEVLEYGHVRLERWNGLHERKAPDLDDDVVRASIHLERKKPPEAIWLAWLPPETIPPAIIVTAHTIWNAYGQRWPVEPGVRFRKENLGWTLPHFQRAESGDMALAHWMPFLARSIVEDMPLPWQKPDPATGASEPEVDFRADWLACPRTQTARKAARLAQRQAPHTQRTPPSGQKGLPAAQTA